MKIKLSNEVNIDLDKLIESRLLVQANSGGGKSYTLRRFIEQTFGKKQIIIIDPEGEFGNLRSAYDFVYVGEGGDAPAEPRSAALLARRLMETKANAIIDIYELGSKRSEFVKNFMDAMVNMPKELWTDCFVVLDEAHKFAPEKGQGESVALSSVIDMASLGRKRGYCLIPATQRPSKLSKDVVAECNNKLIGRASLDIDRKRSAEELGFHTKEEILSLRNLAPGEFYAFGSAISDEVVKTKIGDVQVKPPKRGTGRSIKIAPPTAKVKAILKQLADLPQEAEKELKTVAELKAEIVRLKRVPIHSQVIDTKQIDLEVTRAIMKNDKEWQERVEKERAGWSKQTSGYIKAFKDIEAALVRAGQSSEIIRITAPEIKINPEVIQPGKVMVVSPYQVDGEKVKRGEVQFSELEFTESTINKGEREILTAIGQYPGEGISMEHIAVLTGYKQTSRREYTRKLLAKGYIERRGDYIIITESGEVALGDDFKPIPTGGQELRDHVMQTLPDGEKRVLSAIMDYQGNDVPREYIESETGYKTTSVREYTRKLVARKLVTNEGGRINLADKLR